MSKTIVLAGSLAQRPGHGGHTWVFLQYLLGFRRLGWEVIFVDWLAPEMCVDRNGKPCAIDQSWNLAYFTDVMEHFGFAGAFTLICDGGRRFLGLPRDVLVDKTRQAAFLFNVMGFLKDEEILAAAQRRIFLDIDPGFGQMWCELGLSNIFTGHDDFVTIAENMGAADCALPTCGLKWTTTPQPVVLEHWPVGPATKENGFTTIATWRGRFAPIEYKGKTYGLRVHEFRRFAQLPRLSGEQFTLALDIDPTEEKDLTLLAENNWSIVDPHVAAGDSWRYQQFVQNSKAEFMVAKNMYVETRGGWFSDRSICYLASARPVLAQRTGWPYPDGKGLIGFSTLEEAVDGAKQITENYIEHSRAAREIAENHFDSDKVLSRLLKKLRIE
jgi:hypothetical protein